VLCFLLRETEKKVKCCSILDHFVNHLLDRHLGGPGWESKENKILRLFRDVHELTLTGKLEQLIVCIHLSYPEFYMPFK
jgi:hypothetical protein